jgi:hypothetical protein
MTKKNDPQYLKDLLRRCLDFWASPYVEDMPDIDFFDDIVRVTNWKPDPGKVPPAPKGRRRPYTAPKCEEVQLAHQREGGKLEWISVRTV